MYFTYWFINLLNRNPDSKLYPQREQLKIVILLSSERSKRLPTIVLPHLSHEIAFTITHKI